MPFDRRLYPADWRAISARVRERDGHSCRFCGVPDRATGYRDAHGVFIPVAPLYADDAELDGYKVIRIVLTVAHVHDPDPQNCAGDNLAALCQRCHNRLDAAQRRRHASATIARRKSAGMATLFEIEAM